jgi:ankyrin repeat protein
LPLPDEELRDVIRAAARHGNLLLVSFLVDMYYKPGPLQSRIQEKVLLQAAYSGREELVESMIATGVSVNCIASRDTYTMPGFSPIHCAAYKGRASITRILLSNGADRDRCNRSRMVRGSLTALGHAIGRGHENVVRILLDAGATMPTSLLSKQDLLFFNAYAHHHHITRLLIEEAAHHNEPIDWNNLSVDAAFRHAIATGDLAMVRIMVEAGCSTTYIVKEFYDAPVLLAMRYGWAHIAKFIIDAGAKQIDPWDPETYPSDEFRCEHYPFKFSPLEKIPDQLWHIHGKYQTTVASSCQLLFSGSCVLIR